MGGRSSGPYTCRWWHGASEQPTHGSPSRGKVESRHRRAASEAGSGPSRRDWCAFTSLPVNSPLAFGKLELLGLIGDYRQGLVPLRGNDGCWPYRAVAGKMQLGYGVLTCACTGVAGRRPGGVGNPRIRPAVLRIAEFRARSTGLCRSNAGTHIHGARQGNRLCRRQCC